jgi:hypothetical protein
VNMFITDHGCPCQLPISGFCREMGIVQAASTAPALT